MARPIFPTAEMVWSRAAAYKSTYFADQNALLKESLERARKELVDKYNANVTYTEYQKDLIGVYQDDLAALRNGLNDYEKNKTPGKGSESGDAALLKIIVDSSDVVADATGDAAGRRLTAQGQVEAGFNLSPAQSNEISKASSFVGTDLNNVTTAADAKRKIDEAVASIPAGTFAPNADSSKTATSQLYAALNSKLGASPMYASDPTLQVYLQQAVIGKMRVDPTFIKLENVEADKKIKMKKQGDIAASVGGLDMAKEAARLAKEALNKDKPAELTGDKKAAADEFMKTDQYMQYKMLVEKGYTLDEARQIVADRVGAGGDGVAQAKFMDDFSNAQDALAQGADYDLYKYLDIGYVDLVASIAKTEGSLAGAKENFAYGVRGVQDLPTEEQVRRRGVEINAPLTPGFVRRNLPQAQRALEIAQSTGGMRKPTLDMAGNPYKSEDDYLASRLLPPATRPPPVLSATDRVVGGATRRAVQANWSPEEYNDTVNHGDGFSLYNKVKDKSLEGGTDKENIVKAAAALSRGDLQKRDDIMRDYYVYVLQDKKSKEPQNQRDPLDPDPDGNLP
jgi:hypothetical protein